MSRNVEPPTSVRSARVSAVRALSKKSERITTSQFIAEGIQSVREALTYDSDSIVELYATRSMIAQYPILSEAVEIADDVLAAMCDTKSPQGVIAVCRLPNITISSLNAPQGRVAILSNVRDPGNAGTILRTADAMGITAVITSPDSVDMYSPKVVRSTAGSLWNMPVYEGVTFQTLASIFPGSQKILFSSHASTSILDLKIAGDCIAVFGNEARGVDAAALGAAVTEVTIPMAGNAESLNLSAAASIVMFTLSAKVAG